MTAGDVHQLASRFNRIIRADVAPVTKDAWLGNLQSDIESMYGINNKPDDGNDHADKYAVAMHQAITEERMTVA